MSTTDSAPLRICKLEKVMISELRRCKSNEWLKKTETSFKCGSGFTFQAMISVRNQFPISALAVEVESNNKLEFRIFPVKRVFFPEADTLLQDALLDTKTFDIAANTTTSFLLTANIPADFKPGDYCIKLKLSSASHSDWNGKFNLLVNELSIKSEVADDLRITFWPHWETFCLQLGLKLWSEEFWDAAKKYLKEMAKGGMNVAMVSINSDPFRYPLPKRFYHYNFYPGMIEWRKDADGSFSFDYSIYDRYIKLNIALGIDKEIECHSLLPCKTQAPYLSYYDEKSGEKFEFVTTWQAPEYQEAWRAFLRDFVEHNRKRGWLELITICPYDEPQDVASFRGVAQMVKAIAPEIRISAAISADKALELLDCIDVATVHLEHGFDPDKVKKLQSSGVDVRWYSCCIPDWGNTLFASDLIEAWRIPWICIANKLTGYLRWSIIDWPEDLWNNPAFNWPTGDMHLLYPGEKGPISSLRWEVYKTGLQDLKLFLAVQKTASSEQKQLMQKYLYKVGKAASLGNTLNLIEARNEFFSLLFEDTKKTDMVNSF
jgi:Glycoside hydrolase 123, catalytic domain